MLVFLAFLSAFSATTTDIYIPALPEMVMAMETTRAKVNLSLSTFFVSFAFGLLLWGPLSEKYGRKKILLTGLIVYIISSFICSITNSINSLIVARIFQGIGASSATAIATALVKDVYQNSTHRARVLSIIMSLVIIAPIIAPVIGAQALKYASWRAIFLALGVFGCIGFICSLFLTETVSQKNDLSIIKSLQRPFALLKVPRIVISLLLFSSVTTPLMAFLAAAAFIYSEQFGFSEQTFSLFFSFNAACAMLGPVIYLRFSKYFKNSTFIYAGYIVIVLSGLIMLLTGHNSPYLFAIGMAIATIAIISLRAPGVNIILEQYDSETGSLSSLINFSGIVFGFMGMTLISMNGLDQIYVLSSLLLIVGIVGFFAWHFIRKSNLIRYEN